MITVKCHVFEYQKFTEHDYNKIPLVEDSCLTNHMEYFLTHNENDFEIATESSFVVALLEYYHLNEDMNVIFILNNKEYPLNKYGINTELNNFDLVHNAYMDFVIKRAKLASKKHKKDNEK